MITESWENSHELWNYLREDPVAKTSEASEKYTQKYFNAMYEQHLKDRDLVSSIDFMYSLSGVSKSVDPETGEIDYSVLDSDAINSLIFNLNEVYEAISLFTTANNISDFPFSVDSGKNVVYTSGRESINLTRISILYKRLLEKNDELKRDSLAADRISSLDRIISSVKPINRKLKQ